MGHERMPVKKLVGCSLFVLGAVRLAVSLVMHLLGHEITLLEVFEALPFLSAGALLYSTDIHKILVSVSHTMYKSVELKGIDALNYRVAGFLRKSSNIMYEYPELKGIDALDYATARFFKRLSDITYKYPELKGIDALNYFIGNVTVSFSRRFRKTHAGVLSYNMLAVIVGAVLLIALVLIFGGYIS
jgi:hypothetical protein